MSDRRLTPANGRVAHVSLLGKVEAAQFVQGEWMRVSFPLADLLARPHGPRDRQVLMGERVLVLERAAGFAFVCAEKDGYCGYLAKAALDADRTATHWVAAPGTHLYPAPDLKTPERAPLSLGARVTVRGESEGFLETEEGLFVPRPHLRKIGDWAEDPAAVAQSLIGTPYLWGGNSRSGIDCSGLVQVALTACGLSCPGDSDLQEVALGRKLMARTPAMRGDLIFWKGHVAIALDELTLIHANAHRMAVSAEPIAAAIARISAQGNLPVTSHRRM